MKMKNRVFLCIVAVLLLAAGCVSNKEMSGFADKDVARINVTLAQVAAGDSSGVVPTLQALKDSLSAQIDAIDNKVNVPAGINKSMAADFVRIELTIDELAAGKPVDATHVLQAVANGFRYRADYWAGRNPVKEGE